MNRYLIYLLLFVALLLPVAAALAQSEGLAAPLGTGYTLSWWTVDSGGATSNGTGGYTLSGTAGQSDAAVWSGGSYTLAGGFWDTPWSETAVESRLYLPLVYRTYTVAPDLVVDNVNYATTYGNVKESNEANNVLGPVVSTADSAEPVSTTAPESTPLQGLPGR